MIIFTIRSLAPLPCRCCWPAAGLAAAPIISWLLGQGRWFPRGRRGEQDSFGVHSWRIAGAHRDFGRSVCVIAATLNYCEIKWVFAGQRISREVLLEFPPIVGFREEYMDGTFVLGCFVAYHLSSSIKIKNKHFPHHTSPCGAVLVFYRLQL